MLKVLAQSQDALAKTGQVHSSLEVRRRAKAALRAASSGK